MTTKLIVLMGFVVAFTAGLLTGVKSRPAPLTISNNAPGPATQQARGRGDRDRGPDRGFLARELNLTSEQREQMREIWSPVAFRGGREQDETRRRYRNERDEAIADLIHTQDLRAYDQILRTFQDKLTALDQEYRTAYQTAVDQTKQILTPEQRAKYDELLKRNQPGERGSGERGGRDGRDGRDDRDGRDGRDGRDDRDRRGER